MFAGISAFAGLITCHDTFPAASEMPTRYVLPQPRFSGHSHPINPAIDSHGSTGFLAASLNISLKPDANIPVFRAVSGWTIWRAVKDTKHSFVHPENHPPSDASACTPTIFAGTFCLFVTRRYINRSIGVSTVSGYIVSAAAVSDVKTIRPPTTLKLSRSFVASSYQSVLPMELAATTATVKPINVSVAGIRLPKIRWRT